MNLHLTNADGDSFIVNKLHFFSAIPSGTGSKVLYNTNPDGVKRSKIVLEPVAELVLFDDDFVKLTGETEIVLSSRRIVSVITNTATSGSTVTYEDEARGTSEIELTDTREVVLNAMAVAAGQIVHDVVDSVIATPSVTFDAASFVMAPGDKIAIIASGVIDGVYEVSSIVPPVGTLNEVITVEPIAADNVADGFLTVIS